jgi:hypothetical protein
MHDLDPADPSGAGLSVSRCRCQPSSPVPGAAPYSERRVPPHRTVLRAQRLESFSSPHKQHFEISARTSMRLLIPLARNPYLSVLSTLLSPNHPTRSHLTSSYIHSYRDACHVVTSRQEVGVFHPTSLPNARSPHSRHTNPGAPEQAARVPDTLESPAISRRWGLSVGLRS